MRAIPYRTLSLCVIACAFGIAPGCRRSEPKTDTPSNTAATELPPATPQAPPDATAQDLLSSRLPLEQTSEGWIRLLDGHTLIGWQLAGNVDWTLQEGAVQATRGDVALMCTSTQWKDYELSLEFNADANTNSGVFLRTNLLATDPKTECYEFNIAPSDNPFPTGSIVGRHRVEPDALGTLEPNQWHRLNLRIEGGHITASINDKAILDWTDPEPLPANFIGLQHNSGRIAFRNVLLRPLGLTALLDKELSKWKAYPDMGGKFEMTDADELHVTGGKGQLESLESYGDFLMLAQVKTNAPELNGGLFFRCIPGEELNGYECQISNAMRDGNPLQPKDCGIGGIFRRVDARIVAAEDQQWASVLVYARGPHLATWVNGLQVVDWQDDRQPDPNPRKGKRLEPGTIMVQAHDETTDLTFAKISVAPQ